MAPATNPVIMIMTEMAIVCAKSKAATKSQFLNMTNKTVLC